MTNLYEKNWGRDSMWGNFNKFIPQNIFNEEQELYLEDPKWIRELSNDQKKKYKPILRRFTEKEKPIPEITFKGEDGKTRRVQTKLNAAYVRSAIKHNKSLDEIIDNFTWYDKYDKKRGKNRILKDDKALEKAVINVLKKESNGKTIDTEESALFSFEPTDINYNIIVNVSKEVFGDKANRLESGNKQENAKKLFSRFIDFAHELKEIRGGYKWNYDHIAPLIIDPGVTIRMISMEPWDPKVFKDAFLKNEEAWVIEKSSVIEKAAASKEDLLKTSALTDELKKLRRSRLKKTSSKNIIEKTTSSKKVNNFKDAIEKTILTIKTLKNLISSEKKEDIFFKTQGMSKRLPILIQDRDPVGLLGNYLKTVVEKYWNDTTNVREYFGVRSKEELIDIESMFHDLGKTISTLSPWTDDEIKKLISGDSNFYSYFTRLSALLNVKKKVAENTSMRLNKEKNDGSKTI